MKIKISYESKEEKEASASVEALLRVLRDAKVRKSDRHAPFKHTYITTRKPETDSGTRGNT